MKPFSTLAIPHKDISEGKLTLDVFAADLWEVFKGRGPAEYKNPELFFRRTYVTHGLSNLLNITEKRVKGKGGDAVIQLQTPFGGGKTHTLIALFHKAREWGINVVVFSGEKFPVGKDELALWEEIERQLTGKVNILKGKVAPGGEKIRQLLEKKQPVIVLLDELHEYITKAAGLRVGDSNLASQTLAFIQELTGAVKTLDQVIMFASIPSSNPYRDEKSEELLQALQSIIGRMEKIYTPVRDEEIDQVIRRRLFNQVDEKEARKVIEEFLDYAEKEKILPEGVDKSDYRDKFLKSYPFLPEVIDVFYKRWGSFPLFHRTRGVLRLLSLVVYALREIQRPFIRLGDIDLKNEEIRRELVKYIGPEFDSIIAQDITSKEAGAKRVDKSLGDAYKAFHFGSVASTSIFLYSFTGGPERGATINEVKLSSVETAVPSSIVVEAVSKLKDNLFYLSEEGLFFTNQPNLNRILLTKVDSIENLKEEEKILILGNLEKKLFEIFIWPSQARDIPDTKRMKLIIIESKKRIKEYFEKCGEKPRVYRNTMIFLCPLETERIGFENFLKRKIAWQMIEKDKSLHLTDEQRKEVKDRAKKAEGEARDRLRTLYRTILLPAKGDSFREVDLGIPTYGLGASIDKEVFDRLRSEGHILEKLSPLTLKDKYLKGKEHVDTQDILESFFKTPGEIRILEEDVLKTCIREGVKQGLFGLGDIENKKPVCRHFREDISPGLVEGELLIQAELCRIQRDKSDEIVAAYETKIKSCTSVDALKKVKDEIVWGYIPEEKKEELEDFLQDKVEELKGKVPSHEKNKLRSLRLKLNVPTGKLADIVRIINYIRGKFEKVDISVEISTKDGEMTVSEYEDKVKEALTQANIEIEEEKS